MEKRRGSILLTKNITPGRVFFDEDTVKDGPDQYRVWDAKKSKLAAAITKGVSQIGLKPGNTVLYLGASHGYTPSYVSDIIGDEGFMFALDFAPRVVRDLVFLCEERKNMAPLLANASLPSDFFHLVTAVDVVYQDIAQRDQAEIFLRNCNVFLKKGGFGILCVKARSIDVTKNPKQIFRLIREKLEKEIIIVDYKELDPLELDHCIFICKKK
jgi:fibrillarin-like pre-rRNA processing protein